MPAPVRTSFIHLFAYLSAIGLAALVAACSGADEFAQGAPDPALADAAYGELTGDPRAGARLFAMCQACHSLEPGVMRAGPSLHGVVGREAGSMAGFAYSDANAGATHVWTGEELFAFLAAPRDYMPGTRMAFYGIADPQQRADLIAFLDQSGE
ncbi:c-type cytochrome [Qipengyuania nanhaisediminis]|uniref:c-type cytochrome n=1 Tax=Qipengyuania nanhaisediminis TaxID=604088 RepID=UPI0038B27CC8